MSNLIGVPTVTRYGASFGKYNGARLDDYTPPNPNVAGLNNADAKSTPEFKSFEQTVKDFILARLGHPVVKVELTGFQIQTCIEEALTKLEYHAPYWMNQFAVFNTSAGINVYELPSEIVNNLGDVWYRRNLFVLGSAPQGSLEYDFALMFFTNTGMFNNYNVGQYLLMQMYLKQVRQVLGQGTSWDIINNKYLQLFPIPDSTESVILEYRALDANTIHPTYKNWVQKYSLCVAKEILGRIRGKFQTLPGPGGGARLDGESLLAEAREEKALLVEELVGEIEGPPMFITG